MGYNLDNRTAPQTIAMGYNRDNRTTLTMHKRQVIIEGNIARIELTQGRCALIDAEDVSRVMAYSWSYHHTGYAKAWIDGKMVLLHRFILGCSNRDEVVDHVNGDGLDCRRSNLRIVSQAVNLRNRAKINSKSGYRGLDYLNQKKPWRLLPRIGNKRISLGYYSEPELPAMLFDCIQYTIADALEIEVSPRSLNFRESDYSDYQSTLTRHLNDSQLDKLNKAVTNLVSKSKCNKAFIYIAQRRDNAIKIGVSRNPHRRVQNIRCGSNCIGWCPETKLIRTHPYPSADLAYTKEAELHSLFSEYHIEGEWFKPEVLSQVLCLL